MAASGPLHLQLARPRTLSPGPHGCFPLTSDLCSGKVGTQQILLFLPCFGIHIKTCLFYGMNTFSGLASRGEEKGKGAMLPLSSLGPSLEDDGGSGKSSVQ